MSEPRNKSLLHWEPFAYILLVVLVVLAGSLDPQGAPVAFWIAAVFAGAATVYFLVAFVSYGRRSRQNPDPAGNLRTLDDITLVPAEHVDSATNPTVTVADANRHQSAIDIVRTRGGERVRAVLVPRSSRWLSRRYRIGVQLVGGGEIRHAGFLPDAADDHWRDSLGALRADDRYVDVPAVIRGSAQPFRVDLDLSGVPAALGAPAAE
ncbi:hypothetical protein [Leifsonia sp. Leaf264]|uniref:hypothetical protein n=1 Tax=Leifsonia sp. Leaf264 TaxID=1736314 RepID=UPI0006FD2DC9|nr:hypothetical protein [Leifsonia sp. Leaf264]KQO99630.1 hypothetical protein ASF30_06870 [Leifsonia sp. Leaf264]